MVRTPASDRLSGDHANPETLVEMFSPSPLGQLKIELSGEEAAAVPQQARVRVELGGTPVEALPVYEYDEQDAI